MRPSARPSGSIDPKGQVSFGFGTVSLGFGRGSVHRRGSADHHRASIDEADAPTVIPWHRLHDFQIMSLALIAEQMLLASPEYQYKKRRRQRLELKVRGELVCELPYFVRPVTIYASLSNGVEPATVVDVLAAECGGLHPVVRAEAPPVTRSERESTPWLLFLSPSMFDGEAGQRLCAELLEWLKADGGSVPHPLMIFNPDKESGGCEFREIIDATPAELKAAGLFAPLALEWRSGAHRDVSLRLLARMLGAHSRECSQ
jgi:hypothetical protein